MSRIRTNRCKLAFVSINLTFCTLDVLSYGLKHGNIYSKARIPLIYPFQKRLLNTFPSFQPQTLQAKEMKRSIHETLSSNSLRRSSRIRQRTKNNGTSSLKSNEKSGSQRSFSQKEKTKNNSDVLSKKTDRKSKPDMNPKKKFNEINTSEKKRFCYLPRERESIVMEKLMNPDLSKSNVIVMGIDEAGRGPLAGPVVAAAAFVPTNIPGIVDSKKITKETERERLFELITSSPNVRWAASFVDAKRIDQINILQATMEAMSKAAGAVMGIHGTDVEENRDLMNNRHIYSSPSAKLKGSYIVSFDYMNNSSSLFASDNDASIQNEQKQLDIEGLENEKKFFALIDGNRVPSTMPCPAECIVKGDSKEYSIAAASIIAKVLRDRLMNEYHESYPKYNLIQNKGYPTAAHISAIKEFGATPIHRRTFAPLKNMKLDDEDI